MAKITEIIIHCTQSKFGSVALIRRWHTDPKPKGNGWRDIGYHFVCLNGRTIRSDDYYEQLDGVIEQGRFQDGDDFLNGDEVGAHAYGINEYSLGYAIVGMGIETFTDKQMVATLEFINKLREKHQIPIEKVKGHYETEHANGKTCPNMDMNWFREQLRSYGIGA